MLTMFLSLRSDFDRRCIYKKIGFPVGSRLFHPVGCRLFCNGGSSCFSNFSNDSGVTCYGVNSYCYFFSYYSYSVFSGSFCFSSCFFVATSEERHAEYYSKH